MPVVQRPYAAFRLYQTNAIPRSYYVASAFVPTALRGFCDIQAANPRWYERGMAAAYPVHTTSGPPTRHRAAIPRSCPEFSHVGHWSLRPLVGPMLSDSVLAYSVLLSALFTPLLFFPCQTQHISPHISRTICASYQSNHAQMLFGRGWMADPFCHSPCRRVGRVVSVSYTWCADCLLC
jgi:hypothetical protein